VKVLENAYKSRLTQAVDHSNQLQRALANLASGTASIGSMKNIRRLVADISQEVHEASAYHNALKAVKG
jgi:hypothetical protein